MMNANHCRRTVSTLLGIVLVSIACMAGAADVPEATIPFRREAPAEESGIVKIVMGFAIAVLALGISLHFLRKRLGSNVGEAPGAKQLRVLETRRLTPRSTLFVVEFAGARYLIAESGQNLSCLGTASARSTSITEQAE